MKKTHSLRRKGPPTSKGDIDVIEAVGHHVEKYVGEIEVVFHEIHSPHVHIDVQVVAPTKERNFFTLVTAGMSEKSMPVPHGAEDGKYAELMICLPAEWPMSEESFREEANWWPVGLLKETARFPFVFDTWLYAGHDIVNGQARCAYANTTEMMSVLLLRPRSLPREAHFIEVSPERRVALWALFPLYEEELRFKLRRGSDVLEKRFVKRGITELLDPCRIRVVN